MLRRLRPLLRPARVERELDAELRFEIESRVEALVSAGVDEKEARRRVRLDFGGIEQVKEECRESRCVALMESLTADVRHALRTLRMNAVFSIAATLSLALGIGANTTVFSLMDQVLMRPLPVEEPERLVSFRSFGPNPGMDRNSGLKMSFSYPKYREFRDKAQAFSGVAAVYGEGASLSYRGETDRIDVELVSGNYFEVLGVAAASGRVFTSEDDKTWRAEPYVVISYEYWNRRFGGDPGIIGQAVRVNDAMMTIVGVAAADFRGMKRGAAYEAWVPMMMKSFITPTWPRIHERFWAWLNIVARLKPGVTHEQAGAEANVLYRQMLENEAPLLQGVWTRQRDEFVRRKLELLPGAHGLTWNTDQISTAFIALMGMAGLVLLIACVNVAGLLVARSVARQREVAIRVALGAGSFRIGRQFVAESAVLAALGGVVGLLLAFSIGRPATSLLLGEEAVRLYSVAPDPRVLAFAGAVTLFTVFLFGVAFPRQMLRAPLNEALKNESGTSAGTKSVRLRKALVALQIALCVLLLVGAGLFGRTLQNLRRLDLGFEKQNLITFSADASLAGYEQRRGEQTYRRIEEKLSGIPGVVSAAASGYGVLKGSSNISRYSIEGFEPERPEDTDVREIAVTPAYMRTLGLRLIAGRLFEEADYGARRAAIVNQAFARRYCNGSDPTGRVLKAVFANNDFTMRIVGMIGDEKYTSVREHPQPTVYVPVLYYGSVTFYVRTTAPQATIVRSIRRAVQAEAPGVPIYDLRTMEEQVDSRLRVERMAATLASCFGAIALLLAAVGLYGVIAYVVASRTREIGVRIALGAARASVFRMIMKDVIVLLACGSIPGFAGALVSARYIESSLYGVSGADIVAITIALATCGTVAILAGLIPARRATQIDPVRALRWE